MAGIVPDVLVEGQIEAANNGFEPPRGKGLNWYISYPLFVF
jgi:hypothetical protein